MWPGAKPLWHRRPASQVPGRHAPELRGTASTEYIQPRPLSFYSFVLAPLTITLCIHIQLVSVMGRYLAWDSIGNIATNLLDANPIAILVTVAIALGFPLLLHYLLYRTAASPKSSSFILLGPSGAGKTALFSLVGCQSGNPERIADIADSLSLLRHALRKQHDPLIHPRHLPLQLLLSLRLFLSPRTVIARSMTPLCPKLQGILSNMS